MKKNNYRGLFLASMILCIFWFVSIVFSIVETIFVGFDIWYFPTVVLSVWMAISDVIENGASIADAIQIFFTGLIAMPLVLSITSILFAPLIVIVLAVYGASFFGAVVYCVISYICLVVGLVFSIGLLVNTAKAKNKEYVNVKAAKAAKVFAILGLVSILVAWMPNAFSLISIFRYIVLLVACILAIVGSSKAIKASKEETGIINVV